jgi:DNA-binding MarR family transcriptional regulator
MVSQKLKLENQICHSLYSATNALVRAYRPLLDEIDLTYPQYLLMMALWENDGVMIKDLVTRTRLDAGTLTPILKRLSAKGHIELIKSKSDSRQKEVYLTQAGREMSKQAEQVPERLACQIGLSVEDAVALKTLSEKLFLSLDAGGDRLG